MNIFVTRVAGFIGARVAQMFVAAIAWNWFKLAGRGLG